MVRAEGVAGLQSPRAWRAPRKQRPLRAGPPLHRQTANEPVRFEARRPPSGACTKPWRTRPRPCPILGTIAMVARAAGPIEADCIDLFTTRTVLAPQSLPATTSENPSPTAPSCGTIRRRFYAALAGTLALRAKAVPRPGLPIVTPSPACDRAVAPASGSLHRRGICEVPPCSLRSRGRAHRGHALDHCCRPGCG